MGKIATPFYLAKSLIEYTALYRGRGVEKSWRGRLPEVVSCKSLLFRGSPDLIITTKKEKY